MGRWILTLGFLLGLSARASAAPDESLPPPPSDGSGNPPVVVVPPPFGQPTDPNAPQQAAPPPMYDPGYQVIEPVTVPEQVPVPPGYPLAAARTRLAVIQGLNGAALGAEACALLAPDTENRRCLPFPFLLGGAAALTAGLTVRPGITSDHVTAINSGTVLGAWHGTLILGMSGLLWNPEGVDRHVAALSILGSAQVLGTIGGHFIYRAHPAREGVVDAAAVSSIWGGLVTSMLIAGYANPTEVDAPHLRQFSMMMLGTEAGMGLGILVGRHTHFTPFRALMVHGYALGGGLLGMTVGLPVVLNRSASHDITENDVWRSLGYGSLFGVVIGVVATQGMRDRGIVGPAFSFDVQPITNIAVAEDGTRSVVGTGAIATVSGRL